MDDKKPRLNKYSVTNNVTVGKPIFDTVIIYLFIGLLFAIGLFAVSTVVLELVFRGDYEYPFWFLLISLVIPIVLIASLIMRKNKIVEMNNQDFIYRRFSFVPPFYKQIKIPLNEIEEIRFSYWKIRGTRGVTQEKYYIYLAMKPQLALQTIETLHGGFWKYFHRNLANEVKDYQVYPFQIKAGDLQDKNLDNWSISMICYLEKIHIK
ncbi:MAG: hypothetical protein LBM27_05315 [Lactobacillaceae bacterium]|jgi:hypothetical protein|nr:hypothetical protein [Lactobacillaceae bacterium]